jgi:hypothetical protein
VLHFCLQGTEENLYIESRGPCSGRLQRHLFFTFRRRYDDLVDRDASTCLDALRRVFRANISSETVRSDQGLQREDRIVGCMAWNTNLHPVEFRATTYRGDKSVALYFIRRLRSYLAWFSVASRLAEGNYGTCTEGPKVSCLFCRDSLPR